MPKTYEQVGSQIASDLDDSGQKIITYSWSDFYAINEASTMREARMKDLRQHMLDEHDVLLAYGNKVVLASYDKYTNRVRK
jgi:hypothetical protein